VHPRRLGGMWTVLKVEIFRHRADALEAAGLREWRLAISGHGRKSGESRRTPVNSLEYEGFRCRSPSARIVSDWTPRRRPRCRKRGRIRRRRLLHSWTPKPRSWPIGEDAALSFCAWQALRVFGGVDVAFGGGAVRIETRDPRMTSSRSTAAVNRLATLPTEAWSRGDGQLAPNLSCRRAGYWVGDVAGNVEAFLEGVEAMKHGDVEALLDRAAVAGVERGRDARYRSSLRQY
jgi:hypothetical protein